MAEISAGNKKIAKNTLILYGRTLIVMLVSLYTTRIVLSVLGASDYGVYDVVGGVIGMLGYFNTILSGGVSRFLTIAIGKNDSQKTKDTFALCNTVGFIGALTVLILAETIGLWFVSNKLVIPPERFYAAMWVYQFAVFSAVLTLLQMPYGACIIAHEDMSVYGYMGIIDAVLKLGIAFVLQISNFDHLIFYGALLLSVNLIDIIIYRVYCMRKYDETTFRLLYRKKELGEMLSYSGWTTIGAFASILNSHGITLLLNLFFGTIVNAARGIAGQISKAVRVVYTNFQTASRPQIVKSYACGDIPTMSALIRNVSKYGAYLTMLLIIPLGVHMDGVLHIWLGDNIPEYTVIFTRCVMLQNLFHAIDYPVGSGIQAVGKMKLPNLSTAFIYMIVFPLTYFAFKLGASPFAGYLIFISCTPFVLLVDLLILRKYTGFNIKQYVFQSLLPIFQVFILALIVPILVEMFIHIDGVFISTLTKGFISLIYTATIVFFIGLSSNMREIVLTKLKFRKLC